MKSLVLAEKPSVARDLARVLGSTQTKKGYIEGPKYVVTWALGHLVELQTPEDYDNQYKTWRLEDLPIMPEKMKLKVIRKVSSQFRTVSDLAKRKDIGELIIATDAGREGELVARWIMEKVRWNKPFKRLWISSQTDKAIRDGFKQLKPGKEFNRLYDSAVCRSEADWLIGLNVTRALTTKYEEPLSAGRVQTPTLAMIIEREQVINTFKPSEYWTLTAQFSSFEAAWQKGNEKRIFDEKRAKELHSKLSGEAVVNTIKRKMHKEAQPLPYDLNELQRDANKRFNFSAKKTLNVLQKLYEQHKLVTYPRTDSRYLTTDMVSTMKERLESISAVYKEEVRPILRNAQLPKRVVNNEKVSDHHAIIVTDQPVFLQDLSADERKLYDLIAKRFISLFYPAYEYEVVKAELEVNGEQLVASGKQVVNAGFKKVSGGESEATVKLPDMKEGSKLSIQDVTMKSAFTEPPQRYTEADLLGQMEKHNLGTPATRADIIEKLLQNESIDRQNNRLHATKKGKQLIDLVADELKSPELTAKWERELEAIAKGKGNAKEFLTNIREQTEKLVKQVKTSNQTYKPHNLTGSKCPECGSFLKEKKTKQGRVLVCSSLECSYRRAKDPKLSNRRCPQCHKRMEIHSGKAGTYFQCRSCQVVEKAEDKKKKISKREERKLLNKYNDDGAFGSSLGDALKQALQDKKDK
ncbi:MULTISPECIES: DNA topoisomerase III [Priestia]|uniref:DNA topoisomerase n=1 Tax=Priestia aryabhattai TaxID=412384 RepID=A0AAX6N481_PRIAR|nr:MULTISPECIES: DNA topoisomerase III [Priestia]MBU8853003.1 DNA topoisomerase 3 [Bacillus sp. FJAT-26377]MDU9690599.1 DNA topoisomerase III [Priestia aryabhattai]QDZ80662.1 DNA topoisomerase III [Priestia megaterium]